MFRRVQCALPTLLGNSNACGASRMCAGLPATALHLSRRTLVIGDTKVGVRKCEEHATVLSDLMPIQGSIRYPVQAGNLLGLIDYTGARAAMNFIVGREVEEVFVQPDGLSLSTVAFNSFTFRQAVYAGDLAVFTGHVVHSGNSSLGVHVQLARQGFDSQMPSPVGECYMTLVCVNVKSLKGVSGVVPAVDLARDVDVQRHQEYLCIRNEHKAALKYAATEASKLTLGEEVEDDFNKQKKRKVRMDDTITVGTRSFRQKDTNTNGVIFGGEILQWMAEHATHCARVFAGSLNIKVVGMHNMLFDHPIFVNDVCRLRTRVAYVRDSTMEVDVTITASRKGTVVTTNRASFVLINVDESGKKKSIDVGLDLKNESHKNLLNYHTAKLRYQNIRRAPHSAGGK